MAGDAQQSPDVLNLGEVRANRSPSDESPTPHPKRRWVIMVVVFLVGAMVGSYAWLARTAMLDSAEVGLIVTDVKHDAPLSDGRLTSVSVVVRNIGGDDVTITRARLPGQSTDGDRGRGEVSIPAGGTASVGLNGELHCGTGLPDVVEADVRTPGGETIAELPMPTTVFVYAAHCRSASGEVWIENPPSDAPVDVLDISDSGMVMIIPLSIRSWSVDEVEITDVAVSAGPGLDVEPSGLVGRHETRTVADLRVEWTVTDCARASQVEPIDITVTFADHPAATVRAPESVLPMLIPLPDLVCEL